MSSHLPEAKSNNSFRDFAAFKSNFANNCYYDFLWEKMNILKQTAYFNSESQWQKEFSEKRQNMPKKKLIKKGKYWDVLF